MLDSAQSQVRGYKSGVVGMRRKYLSNEAHRSHCLKRGGKAEFVYLDLEGAEDRYGLEPVEALTPEKIGVLRNVETENEPGD